MIVKSGTMSQYIELLRNVGRFCWNAQLDADGLYQIHCIGQVERLVRGTSQNVCDCTLSRWLSRLLDIVSRMNRPSYLDFLTEISHKNVSIRLTMGIK